MILLDENILDGQRLLLGGWRISACQIGFDTSRKGIKDQEIVVLLRRLRQPTLFTRDQGFYAPDLRYQHYAIVVAAVRQYELAGAFYDTRSLIRSPIAPAKSFGSLQAAYRGGNCGDTKKILQVGSYFHISGLTRLAGRRPSRAATAFSAAIVDIRRRVATDAEAMCGASTTFEQASSAG